MKPKTFSTTIIFLIVIAFLNSCEETIEFKSGEADPKMVGNAVFSGGTKYKYVSVEKSRSILNDRSYFEALPGAIVKLYEDGEFLTEFQYISAIDTFTEHLSYGVTKKYPYEHGSFIDSLFLVKPGSTYRLEVSCEGFEPVSCETTVPHPVELSDMSATIENTPKQYNSNLHKVRIRLALEDPVSSDDFYRLNINHSRGIEAAFRNTIGYGGNYSGGHYGYANNDIDSIVPTDTIIREYGYGSSIYSLDPVLSQPGRADILDTETEWVEFFNDQLMNSRTHELSFWFETNRDVYTDLGEYLQVNAYVASLSKELYNYSISAQQQSQARENPFAEPVPVFSNINGGMGIFGSYSTSFKTTLIGEYPIDGKEYMERSEYYDQNNSSQY